MFLFGVSKKIKNLEEEIEKLNGKIGIANSGVRFANQDIKKIYGKIGTLSDNNKSLRFANHSPHEDPFYAKSGDSGFDIRAWITQEQPTKPETEIQFSEEEKKNYIVLKPFTPTLIHTGLYFELPKGVEMQVRTRSGCALKQGLIVLNCPGTVDNGYRNEVCVIAYNSTTDDIFIYDGDRIAQGVLCNVINEPLVNFIKVDDVSKDTDRGEGGFGHTGVK